ncbi:MAG: LysE family translocator [Deltaproteobacteria bacterium]|nr:LysE family translocator [Deltaproteobacteria bacterium]
MLTYLLSGSVFGLSAGLAPGPLLTLVIAESIRGGLGSGIRVSLAPLITDLPIVFLALFVISELSRFDAVLGVISLFGAAFVAYLGYEGLRTKEMHLSDSSAPTRSLRKGIATNFLNPHPYLFWFSVGSPIIVKAYTVNALAAGAFICGFYAFLVGSKVALAFLVDRSRSFLLGKAYRYTMQVLGAVLLVFAAILLHEGLTFLNVDIKSVLF